MGKKQHQSDRMFITATEWKRDFGGYKGAASGGADFPRLALDCCSLSFLPFEHPVCSPQGHIFELERIVPFLQAHHRNPVTNEPLEVKELIKLKFARDEQGELMCPVLFKPFSEHTHVVAVRTTGNVFSYEAVEQLCLKPKNLRDLLDDTPFTRADLITLQDPHNILARNPANFAHIKDEQMAKMVDGMKNGGAAAASTAAPAAAASTSAAAAAPAGAAARRPRPALGISLATKPDGASAAAASLGPARGLYSSGAVSGSFTSTSMSVATQNDRQVLTAEQILAQRYEHLRKKGAKGYVRLHTTLGNINLELHADMAPKTCHSFMEHCEKGYYNGTKFHRVIPGFMVQGGDPDGTGRGGEGAFEKEFKDEFHSKLRHDARGVLSSANSGPDTNGSQFFLTFAPAPHLDNKHSVFGRLVGGGEVLDAIEKVDTVKTKNDPSGKPKDCPVKDVRITAVTVYTNPFKEDFTPVDALTRRKEGELSEEEARAEQQAREGAEVGKWFSNPQAAGAMGSAAPGAGGDFKYLNLPKPQSDAAQRGKRKGSPNAAEESGTAAAAAHPALRAAAAAGGASTPSAPMDTTQTPKAGAAGGEEDEAAREFAAARRRQLQAKQQAAAAAAAQQPQQTSYGNFGNF